MNEHVEAANGVEGTTNALEIGSAEAELVHVQTGFACPTVGLLGHGFGDVARGDGSGPHGSERQAEAADSAACVAETHIIEFAALLDPGQHFIHGFLVANADVALHLVHIVAFAVDAIPAIEARGFEVTLHLLLFALLVVQQLLGCHGQEEGRIGGDPRRAANGADCCRGPSASAATCRLVGRSAMC